MGTETILLVEDEDSVRTLTRRLLAAQGYAVLEARHGEDALSVAREHPGTIDLVVTDMLMPRMGGRQLAVHLSQNHPNLRVLFMSGYSEDLLPERRPGEPPAAFISKPFTALGLARKVREVLEGHGPG